MTMIKDFKPKYIVDESSKEQAVIIDIDVWKELLERLEMLDDIEAYDKTKEESLEFVDFEEAVKEL